ncbi:MAG: hypothetical protein ACOYMV_10300, partial [Verrucomicrobiia bacterium]
KIDKFALFICYTDLKIGGPPISAREPRVRPGKKRGKWGERENIKRGVLSRLRINWGLAR